MTRINAPDSRFCGADSSAAGTAAAGEAAPAGGVARSVRKALSAAIKNRSILDGTGEDLLTMLQDDNENPLSARLCGNSFAKPDVLCCNKTNFPTRRLARGAGGRGARRVLNPHDPVPSV
ncbi:colicin V production protein [Alicycliphilus sp. B1]|nr:colicin V production protein [Alicycliphilus sp. B1]